MSHKKRALTILLLLVTATLSAYAQDSSPKKDPASESTAGSPTARNFAYPQSLFVDSPNGDIWVTDFDNHRVLRFDVSTLTTVERSLASSLPGESFLSQNYPNPFNPKTHIAFSVTNTGHASLRVYNLLGQEVASLFNEVAAANTVYSVVFDAKNLASGIYVYGLRSAKGYERKRMCLMK